MQKYHDEPKQYKGYLKSALVRTTRSVYRIVVVQPAAGTIVVEGGNLREPMKGRLLLNGHVRYGHRMAMAIGRLEIVTAPVETIAVR